MSDLDTNKVYENENFEYFHLDTPQLFEEFGRVVKARLDNIDNSIAKDVQTNILARILRKKWPLAGGEITPAGFLHEAIAETNMVGALGDDNRQPLSDKEAIAILHSFNNDAKQTTENVEQAQQAANEREDREFEALAQRTETTPHVSIGDLMKNAR